MQIERIGDATLYCGDCSDVMDSFPDCFAVDSVVADPPYGVDLGPSSGHDRYLGFSDNRDYIESCVVPAIKKCISISSAMVVTPGNKNAWAYPEPDDIGGWYNPAGVGCGPWGFILNHLILFYGKDPHARKKGWMASSVEALNDSVAYEKAMGHPCPKPEKFTKWMVGKVSLEGQIVLDPFMGSGTTGVACANLGRKFIGIELEQKYFDIACERIEAAYAQGRLFA